MSQLVDEVDHVFAHRGTVDAVDEPVDEIIINYLRISQVSHFASSPNLL